MLKLLLNFLTQVYKESSGMDSPTVISIKFLLVMFMASQSENLCKLRIECDNWIPLQS